MKDEEVIAGEKDDDEDKPQCVPLGERKKGINYEGDKEKEVEEGKYPVKHHSQERRELS